MKKFLATLFGLASIEITAEEISGQLELSDDQVATLNTYLTERQKAFDALPSANASIKAINDAITAAGVELTAELTAAAAITAMAADLSTANDNLTTAKDTITAAETALTANNHSAVEGDLAAAINKLGDADAGTPSTPAAETDNIEGDAVINKDAKHNKAAAQIVGDTEFRMVPKEKKD